MKFNWRSLALSGVVATGAVHSAGIATAQPKAPTRVLALSTTNVEIIGALGKSSTIVGIDRSAKHLKFPYLDKIPDVGHPYQPNIEGILSLKPQLVLANKENLKPAAAEQLRTAKVPVTILEESYKDGIAGLKRRVMTVANIYREPAKGKAINARIDAQMRQLNAKVAKAKKKPKIFFLYAHGPGDAYVYGRDTGSDVLIRLSGGVNAADFTTGTKPLTAEAMVQAAPDAIIMLGRGLKAVGGVQGALDLPGVMLTPAGKNKKIIQVDDSIRWVGPRFPAFASKLFDQTH